MSDSSVTRMLKGEAIPDARFFAPLAQAIGQPVLDVLERSELFPPGSLRPLSETDQSQVRSSPISPSEAADRLGITDPVERNMLIGTIERLKRLQQGAEPRTDQGGTAAQG